WGGFVIASGRRRVYFAGDTAYSPLFKQIRERIGVVDLALLPIAAYEPRWFMQSVHMNPPEAVQAHGALGSPSSIGLHFGTFQLTAEGLDAALQDLAQARDRQHISADEFRTLDFGESVALR